MMPFKEPFDMYYTAIFKPAIEEAGLKPVRADDLFRLSVIVSDIWQMIRGAGVLLAELTTKNANVFYELGLAHALGKPVVLVSENMSDVPFDLQQLRVLLYDKDNPSWGDSFTLEIVSSLKQTISEPIEAILPIFRTKQTTFAPDEEALSSRVEDLESQVRLLRARSTPTRTRLSLARERIREELYRVGSESELDEFFLANHRGRVPLSLLLAEVRNHPRVPDGEAERLEEQF